MRKNSFTSSVLICLTAAILGAAYFVVHEFDYETQHGPPLITDGFIKKAEIAIKKDPWFTPDFYVGAIGKNEFYLQASKYDRTTVYVRKINTDKYIVNIGLIGAFNPYENTCNFNKTSPRTNGKIKNKESIVSLKELNRIIDSKIFQDSRTRVIEKRKLLTRLDELTSKRKL